MTAAVEEELKTRIAALEADVAQLQLELERSEIRAAVRRGKDEADRGLGVPARELVDQLRIKHNVPRS